MIRQIWQCRLLVVYLDMEEIIKYIIRFLTGCDDDSCCDMVGYTACVEDFHKYRVVVIPCGFFDKDTYGTEKSLPDLPLDDIDGVPLLFGNPECKMYGDTLVTSADIIAGTFFFLSRYEEFVRRGVRDVHGRFPGRESLAYKAGFIDCPLIDEYGRLLRKWLGLAGAGIHEKKNGCSKIWLTHDIDAPFFCRSLRNVLRETLKGCGLLKALSFYYGKLENDPYYTFPWILQEDMKLKERLGSKCESLFFVKTGGKDVHDHPFYDMSSRDVREMSRLLSGYGAVIGLHSSYESGNKPALVVKEKEKLEKEWGINVSCNRNHYLRSCEPENFISLIDAGITDDFTMGYADVCGFRIGTSRPAKWIDPAGMKLTDLIMHPLLVMDCTLSDLQYMGLTMDEAFDYCVRLASKACEYGGEIVLLWHNTSFLPVSGDCFDHRKLYDMIIDHISIMSD